MADIKRLHYFNHQFLVESDFTDEQQYHLVMRRRHNAALHDYGVADGLAVSRSGDREITIQPGMAIDRGGRELVLLDSRIVSLSDTAAFPAGATVHVGRRSMSRSPTTKREAIRVPPPASRATPAPWKGRRYWRPPRRRRVTAA